jgi:hypothetical protein
MLKKNGERRHPRIPVPEGVKCRLAPAWSAQIIDISVGGARVEHHGLLKPGGLSRLVISHKKIDVELPCKVVWSKVVGAKEIGGTKRELLCQSGVKFQGLNSEKEASLTLLLESFASHARP